MGATNVKLVYAAWAELPHAPFRVLAYMALTARDDDDPALFWGGRETLACAVGRMVPDDDDDEDVRAERRAAFRAVDRAVSLLVRVRAITIVRTAHRGRQAVYRLNLTRESTTPTVVHSPPESTTLNVVHSRESTTFSGQKAPRSAVKCTTLSGQMHHAQRGPEDKEEEEEDKKIRIAPQSPRADAQPSAASPASNQTHTYVERTDGIDRCAQCDYPRPNTRMHGTRTTGQTVHPS